MRDQGLGSWIARRARMAPHRRALVFQERTWTYADLQERIARLAGGLASLGVRWGDRVGYLGPAHPSFLETLFATASLGAITVSINHRLAAPEVAYIVNDAGCRVLVFGPDAAALVEGARSEVGVERYVAIGREAGTVDAYEALLATAPAHPVDRPVGLDSVCLLVYTSGTTGRPKGVMLTHGNLTWNVMNFMSCADFLSDDVTLAIAPFYRIGALGVTVLPTLFKGGTVVLAPTFDAQQVLDLIERHRVTTLFGGPELLSGLPRAPRWSDADLSTLRFVLTGGAPVPEPLIRTYLDRGVPFLQGFGLSEAAPLALMLDKADMLTKVGSAGRPPFFSDVRVLRSDMTDVGPGEVGELVVQGPNVMRGYWNRPDATDEAIRAGGWLRTGDAAIVDDEGFVFVVDRIKDMYVSAGENVFPAEIERALSEHPQVLDAAVVGVPDENLGHAGVAFVVLRPGAATAPDELLDFISDRVAGFKLPRSVEVVEELPRNPAGKVLKWVLREKHGG